MEVITNRSYTEADLEAVIDLFLACPLEEHDKWPDVDGIRDLLTPPRLDHEMNGVRIWETVDGRIMAIVILWANLTFYIHPDIRGSHVESELLNWSKAQMHTLAPNDKGDLTIYTSVREDFSYLINLLERHEFFRRNTYKITLTRSLHDPIPDASLPEGFFIRPVESLREVEDFVALHRDAFGTKSMTVEWRRAYMSRPEYIPPLDLVAVAPDGTLASFCVCHIDETMAVHAGTREGWTDPIGTRPAYRRMGLNRALILEGFRRLKAQGVDTAIVGTGSWNTAARSLLESVGYRILYKVLYYEYTQFSH